MKSIQDPCKVSDIARDVDASARQLFDSNFRDVYDLLRYRNNP